MRRTRLWMSLLAPWTRTPATAKPLFQRRRAPAQAKQALATSPVRAPVTRRKRRRMRRPPAQTATAAPAKSLRMRRRARAVRRAQPHPEPLTVILMRVTVTKVTQTTRRRDLTPPLMCHRLSQPNKCRPS